MVAVPARADVVVIGAGIVGNSMAYHLAEQGWRNIVLLDKGPMPSPGGSTGHASNFIFLTDHSKEMTAFTVDSARQYKELDVFTQISAGHTTAEALAAACGAQTEPLRMVLEWCVADGMLTRDGAHYQNTPATQAYLVKGQPAYAANGLKYAQDLYPVWSGLTGLVRTGRPAIDPESILGDDKEKTRAFIYAMHERARGLSSVLPALVDFSGRTRLLDVPRAAFAQVRLGARDELDHALVGITRCRAEREEAVVEQHHADGVVDSLARQLLGAHAGQIEARHHVRDHDHRVPIQQYRDHAPRIFLRDLRTLSDGRRHSGNPLLAPADNRRTRP